MLPNSHASTTCRVYSKLTLTVYRTLTRGRAPSLNALCLPHMLKRFLAPLPRLQRDALMRVGDHNILRSCAGTWPMNAMGGAFEDWTKAVEAATAGENQA